MGPGKEQLDLGTGQLGWESEQLDLGTGQLGWGRGGNVM